MERCYNISPDIWGKVFTDWFAKCSDGFIVAIWYKFINFPLPLIRAFHRMGNSPNIPCPRSREQDESHPYFIFYCKLSKITLDFISGLINLNFTLYIYILSLISPKAKAILNENPKYPNFIMVYIRRFSLFFLKVFLSHFL